jgi:hypothetical protein
MEAGSIQDLKGILEDLLITPSLIPEIGRQAMETARNRPWERYQEELSATIINFKGMLD